MNTNIELITKNLKNLGFTMCAARSRTLLSRWELNQGIELVRVDICVDANISIFKFARNMILDWKVENMDADSVPFLAINAVIDEAVRS